MRFVVVATVFSLVAMFAPAAFAAGHSVHLAWRAPLIRLSHQIGRDATKSFLRPLVRGYIEFMRDVARTGALPLTENEKAFLRAFFPQRLLDQVRVAELGVAGLGNSSAGAAAYGPDLVVVKRGYRTPHILKHEMVHVCQYDKLGIAEFARRYADQFVDANFVYDRVPFEAEAHAFKVHGRGRFSGLLGPCD